MNPLPESAVEMAARAMHEAQRQGGYAKDWDWHEVGAAYQDHYRRMARAALPAIREAVVGEVMAVVREMDCDEKGKPYVYTQPSMVIWTEKWRGWVARLRAAALTEQENRNDQERSHDGG